VVRALFSHSPLDIGKNYASFPQLGEKSVSCNTIENRMRSIVSNLGKVSLAAGVLNLVFLLIFGWRTSDRVGSATLLWIPLAIVACGLAGLIAGGKPRAPAVAGVACGLLPLAFVAMLYWAFASGSASFVFK
jgi:hypothetical protein